MMKYVLVGVLLFGVIVNGDEIWKGKKYRSIEKINVDKYMEVLGVGFILRTIGNTVPVTIELKKNGDQYSLNTYTWFRNWEVPFKLGKEFPELTGDGRNVISLLTMDGNILTHEQTGNPPTKTTYDFRDREMIATMMAGGVTATIKYVVD